MVRDEGIGPSSRSPYECNPSQAFVNGASGRLYTYVFILMDDALFPKLQRLMVTLVGIEPNMTRVKISYPEPLDDRAIS